MRPCNCDCNWCEACDGKPKDFEGTANLVNDPWTENQRLTARVTLLETGLDNAREALNYYFSDKEDYDLIAERAIKKITKLLENK